jgi:hypothetical protein
MHARARQKNAKCLEYPIAEWEGLQGNDPQSGLQLHIYRDHPDAVLTTRLPGCRE